MRLIQGPLTARRKWRSTTCGRTRGPGLSIQVMVVFTALTYPQSMSMLQQHPCWEKLFIGYILGGKGVCSITSPAQPAQIVCQPAECMGMWSAATTEDTGSTPQQPTSDSSSDSDYDEQLARKIKQCNSYGNSDADSFLSQTASVLMPTAAAAASSMALFRHGSTTISTDDSKESIAKLVGTPSTSILSLKRSFATFGNPLINPFH